MATETARGGHGARPRAWRTHELRPSGGDEPDRDGFQGGDAIEAAGALDSAARDARLCFPRLRDSGRHAGWGQSALHPSHAGLLARSGPFRSDAFHRRGATRAPSFCFCAVRRRRAYVPWTALRLYAGEMLRPAFFAKLKRLAAAGHHAELADVANSKTTRWFARHSHGGVARRTTARTSSGTIQCGAMRSAAGLIEGLAHRDITLLLLRPVAPPRDCAVDHQIVSVDEAGFVAGEEDGGMRDILRETGARDRLGRPGGLAHDGRGFLGGFRR